jgi:hypothetical protein
MHNRLKEITRKPEEGKGLNVCRTSEVLTAVENRISAGMLSEREADALCSYYGFERAP